MQSGSVDVLWVARYDYCANHVLEDHRHNYWQLLYILEGTGSFTLEEQQYTMDPDTIYLIKVNQLHGFSVNDTEALKTLDIKFNLHGKPAYGSGLESVVGKPMDKLKPMFEKIHLEAMRKSVFYKELSSLYLEEMLIYLVRELNLESTVGDDDKRFQIDKVADPICQMVEDFFEEHYSEDLSLSDIAESIGYHQGYLCTAFKKAFGCTIMQYLYRYTRLFHEIEGLTPGQYRDREKDMICKGIHLDDSFVNIS